MTDVSTLDFLSEVRGQDGAVAQLRAAVSRPVHAYLFVGPPGSGKREAAMSFAGCLLRDERAARGRHPDVTVVERIGASINVEQAREISRLSLRSPVEGSRKVIILDEFHLVEEAAPALLKTIEEAPGSTVFVVLADTVTRDLVTIASRCVRIDFATISNEVIESVLCHDGVPTERATFAATNSFGNLERARLLALDDSAVERRELWGGALNVLDGTGTAAARLATEIITALDAASTPLVERQQLQRQDVEDQVQNKMATGQALKTLESRHKRELRRLRTDELRAGFATMAQTLSAKLQLAVDQVGAREAEAGLEALRWASESLQHNPNESLMLQGLFVRITNRV